MLRRTVGAAIAAAAGTGSMYLVYWPLRDAVRLRNRVVDEGFAATREDLPDLPVRSISPLAGDGMRCELTGLGVQIAPEKEPLSAIGSHVASSGAEVWNRVVLGMRDNVMPQMFPEANPAPPKVVENLSAAADRVAQLPAVRDTLNLTQPVVESATSGVSAAAGSVTTSIESVRSGLETHAQIADPYVRDAWRAVRPAVYLVRDMGRAAWDRVVEPQTQLDAALARARVTSPPSPGK